MFWLLMARTLQYLIVSSYMLLRHMFIYLIIYLVTVILVIYIYNYIYILCIWYAYYRITYL